MVEDKTREVQQILANDPHVLCVVARRLKDAHTFPSLGGSDNVWEVCFESRWRDKAGYKYYQDMIVHVSVLKDEAAIVHLARSANHSMRAMEAESA